MKLNLIHGDTLDRLRELPDASVDAIVTDPPYGLSAEPDMAVVLRHWLDGDDYQHRGGGFMGKSWDSFVPGPKVWAECHRVLKPGGHLVAFAGTRTQDLMATAIRLGGFQIRDTLAWAYGCLDEETEVATADGVKPYNRVKEGDLVLCYNTENGEYSYQPILETVEYEYRDTAYRLVGDFGEQVVSRNHRVIVERNGVEVFEYAEDAAREQQAYVPILESLPSLQEALRDQQPSAGGSEQNLLAGVLERSDRGGTTEKEKADRGTQGEGGRLRLLREIGVEARCVDKEGEAPHVQHKVQWETQGSGPCPPQSQRAGGLETGDGTGAKEANDRGLEPCVERGPYVPQTKGRVRRPTDQVRSVPEEIREHGPQGRVRYGASAKRSNRPGAAPGEVGSGPPHQSRRDGQPDGEPHGVSDKRGAQSIRAWGGHKAALVRVEPFRYVGRVWCLRVPTGAFVAVRNGVAFPTGNSGFPKSRDVSKDLDKLDAKEASRSVALAVTQWIRGQGVTARQIDEATGTNMGGRYTTAASQPATPTREHLEAMRHLFADPVPWWVEEVVDSRDVDSPNYAAREVMGYDRRMNEPSGIVTAGREGQREEVERVLSAAHTPLAQQWEGWGTALKPAMEPIILARKKPEGSIADNLVAHGCGALNIDGCRVPSDQQHKDKCASVVGLASNRNGDCYGDWQGEREDSYSPAGRWPANLLHDGSDEATEGLGAAARYFYCAKASRADRNDGLEHDLPVLGGGEATDRAEGSAGTSNPRAGAGRTGGSRNPHPTVKPTELMAWLVRLVTPPGGHVLDPFVGSGSTGRGCAQDGVGEFTGIDQSAEYLEVSRLRILAAL